MLEFMVLVQCWLPSTSAAARERDNTLMRLSPKQRPRFLDPITSTASSTLGRQSRQETKQLMLRRMVVIVVRVMIHGVSLLSTQRKNGAVFVRFWMTLHGQQIRSSQ